VEAGIGPEGLDYQKSMGFSSSEVPLLQHCIEGMWCRAGKMDLYFPGELTQNAGFALSCGSEAPLFRELGAVLPLGVCSESLWKLVRLVSLGL